MIQGPGELSLAVETSHVEEPLEELAARFIAPIILFLS